MKSQFNRGILEICVMSFLVDEDLYGYAIINRLSQKIDVTENTIYPILRRLTKEGFFDTYLKESQAGAPRKYYRMTYKGINHFLRQKDEWDAFISGVYQILNQGVSDDETILKRFKERTES